MDNYQVRHIFSPSPLTGGILVPGRRVQMRIGAVYHRKKQKSHHSDTHRCVQEWIEPAGHKIDSGAPSTAHAFVPGTERTRRADVSPKQEQEPRQKTSDKKTADYLENHRCLTLLPAKFKSHGLRRWDNQARFSRSGNNAICQPHGSEEVQMGHNFDQKGRLTYHTPPIVSGRFTSSRKIHRACHG